MRVAVLFTDGVGVGPRDDTTNPLARGEYLLSQFADGSGTPLPGGGQRYDVDTTFGVPGRPQSASNQTAILTATPAPRTIGRHVLGYPNAALKEILATHSIVRRITGAGRTATFANAYPVPYLEALGLRPRTADSENPWPARILRRIKPSASTLAMSAAGVPFRTLEDARADLGLTPDVDGSMAKRRHLPAPERSPADAARVFWRLAADFTLFEHYLADEAGHAQDVEAATNALATFDAFARAVIDARPDDCQVLICSDHGNVEDLSIRSHTRNPVAVLSFGDARFSPPVDVSGVGASALTILGVGA
ncbi:MAG TPA: metalloenzyme [Archangium sp.]